jgi:DNA-binding XRE family transcriptional regulator
VITLEGKETEKQVRSFSEELCRVAHRFFSARSANVRREMAAEKELVHHPVKQYAQHRGLSKYAVAQCSGASESMVGLVERGLRNPSIELPLRLP